MRDGIDVPGRSLRLIVFERVPWPRPTLLHRARRDAFGGRAYEEMLTRLKLKQAYGRLVRRAGDRGVFVMLDRQLPSRLRAPFRRALRSNASASPRRSPQPRRCWAAGTDGPRPRPDGPDPKAARLAQPASFAATFAT